MVFTDDGGCPNNGKGGDRAGIGIWWNHGHKLKVSERVKGEKQTNNVGEIQAIVRAILLSIEMKTIKKLQVNTDSKFIINSVTKCMAGWKKKFWKKADGKEMWGLRSSGSTSRVMLASRATRRQKSWPWQGP